MSVSRRVNHCGCGRKFGQSRRPVTAAERVGRRSLVALGLVGLRLASSLGAVAFLELFLTAAWARIIAANIFQRVAHRLWVRMAAVGTMHVALVVAVLMLVVVVVIVLAVWTVNVGLLLHGAYSGM